MSLGTIEHAKRIKETRKESFRFLEQINKLADRINFPLSTVELILKDYRNLLRYQIEKGQDVTVLGFISIRDAGSSYSWTETIGSQANHISKARGISTNIVLGILEAYYDLIIEELASGADIVITGLLTLTTKGGRVYLNVSSMVDTDKRGFILENFKYNLRNFTNGKLFGKNGR